MTPNELRYIVAVAEHRHFGEAARACCISQPTLSTQIKKLEAQLGVMPLEGTEQIGAADPPRRQGRAQGAQGAR